MSKLSVAVEGASDVAARDAAKAQIATALTTVENLPEGEFRQYDSVSSSRTEEFSVRGQETEIILSRPPVTGIVAVLVNGVPPDDFSFSTDRITFPARLGETDVRFSVSVEYNFTRLSEICWHNSPEGKILCVRTEQNSSCKELRVADGDRWSTDQLAEYSDILTDLLT